jgi:hypothetical protein
MIDVTIVCGARYSEDVSQLCFALNFKVCGNNQFADARKSEAACSAAIASAVAAAF